MGIRSGLPGATTRHATWDVTVSGMGWDGMGWDGRAYLSLISLILIQVVYTFLLSLVSALFFTSFLYFSHSGMSSVDAISCPIPSFAWFSLSTQAWMFLQGRCDIVRSGLIEA